MKSGNVIFPLFVLCAPQPVCHPNQWKSLSVLDGACAEALREVRQMLELLLCSKVQQVGCQPRQVSSLLKLDAGI